MSAEVLRRAAELMREQAEAVQPLGVWIEDDWTPDPGTPLINYTASWSPAVALAVADWLDGVALFVEAKDDEEYFDLDGDPIAAEDTHAIGSALTVARAYLGESA